MADTKISALASGTPALSTDKIPIARGSGNYSLTPSDIVAVASPTLTGPVTITEAVGSSDLTLTGATQTTSQPVLNMTQTWNAGAVTFTGVKLNVTDTASATVSNFLDFQLAAVTQFRILKNGIVQPFNNTLKVGGNAGNGAVSVIGNDFVDRGSLSSTGVFIVSAAQIAWSSNANGPSTLNTDLILIRKASANIQLGAADAAAPVAQTLSVQSVVTGTTNTAGANFTITGSQGTGTGAGGSIIFQTAPAGTTGSTQNALVNTATISPTGLTLSSTATGLAPSLTATGTDTNVSLNLATKGTGTLQINGTAWQKTKTTLFTSSGTYTPSTGVIAIGVLIVGGGGGGGFGGTYAAATGGSGGAGGGGAAAFFQTFRASDISGTPAINIGSGGAGGQSGVTPTGGSIAGQGAYGNITSFGTYIYAGGGGGGAPGISTTASGGGSGGLVANVNGGFGTNAAGGSNPLFLGNGGFGAAGSFSGTTYGAGGGGTTALGVPFTGGVNIAAPAGGAGGGGFNASGVAQSGANAQTIILATGGASYVGGGAAGAASVAAVAGAAGSAIPWPYLGPYIATGGAGGGAGFGTAVTGGNGAVGGAGGNYGGGGGGGGAGNSTNSFVGGNGGSGAGGLVFIVEYF